MKTRRLMCVLAACVLILAGIILFSVNYLQGGIEPQTTVMFKNVFADNSVHTVTQPLFLPANQLVHINCSCSLLSANIDYGVIASDGKFYYINRKEGSINQTIRISRAGSYQVAIRNNSSQTVRVGGFVDY